MTDECRHLEDASEILILSGQLLKYVWIEDDKQLNKRKDDDRQVDYAGLE